MTDIQFNEEQEFRRPTQEPKKKSLFVQFVLATGVVTTDRQAEYVLLGMSAIFLILAFLIPVLFGNSSAPAPKDSAGPLIPATNRR